LLNFNSIPALDDPSYHQHFIIVIMLPIQAVATTPSASPTYQQTFCGKRTSACGALISSK
jgi:hypothetical protein